MLSNAVARNPGICRHTFEVGDNVFGQTNRHRLFELGCVGVFADFILARSYSSLMAFHFLQETVVCPRSVVFCTMVGREIVILHGFIKKTQETPGRELKTARKRLKEVKNA